MAEVSFCPSEDSRFLDSHPSGTLTSSGIPPKTPRLLVQLGLLRFEIDPFFPFGPLGQWSWLDEEDVGISDRGRAP